MVGWWGWNSENTKIWDDFCCSIRPHWYAIIWITVFPSLPCRIKLCQRGKKIQAYVVPKEGHFGQITPNYLLSLMSSLLCRLNWRIMILFIQVFHSFNLNCSIYWGYHKTVENYKIISQCPISTDITVNGNPILRRQLCITFSSVCVPAFCKW